MLNIHMHGVCLWFLSAEGVPGSLRLVQLSFIFGLHVYVWLSVDVGKMGPCTAA